MEDRIPTSVLSIIKATQEEGEKLTTLTCRMTGKFEPFTESIIFPGERKFQVRDLKHIDGDTYSVKVKGIPFKDCLPFSIITPVDLKVRYSKKAYFIPSEYKKNVYSGEYSITGGIFTGYRMFNKEKYKAKVSQTGNLYSVTFPFKSPLVPGALYEFEGIKGTKEDMTLIYPGELSKKSESIISARLDKFRSMPGVKAIYSIILRTDNYVELPSFLMDEEFEGSIKMDNKRVMDREYNAVKNKIIKQSKASGGVLFNSVKKSCNVTPAFFHSVCDQLVSEKLVFVDGDYLINNSDDRYQFLSPLSKKSYELIQNVGSEGISIRSIKDYGTINCFNEIKRMRLAHVLDGDIFYSNLGFKELLNKIFSNKQIGDHLTIQEIRDYTGLSRRLIISLLNELENDNIFTRDEDDEKIINKIP